MKTIQDLPATLAAHATWLRGEGGEPANLRSSNLRGAALAGSDLTGADLTGASLYGADLTGASLYGADLRGADLTGADLTGAALYSSDLTGANLRGSNLTGADLTGASLYGADLTGASLYGADLRGADLAESVGARFADCAFSGHGERGRRLLVVEIGGAATCFYGSFRGSLAELRDYIAAGDPSLRESRTKAADFVVSCFE